MTVLIGLYLVLSAMSDWERLCDIFVTVYLKFSEETLNYKSIAVYNSDDRCKQSMSETNYEVLVRELVDVVSCCNRVSWRWTSQQFALRISVVGSQKTKI